MESFLSRILTRLGLVRKEAKRTRRARTRKLFGEQMESRKLLAGDLGTISGDVFTDLTDNGFDVSDTAISGATIFLYQDGGNGTFDSSGGSAGGDDTLLTQTTSDVNGDYSFADLADGTYFVEQDAVTGQLQRVIETVKTVTISASESAGVATQTVDDFNTTAQTLVANTGTPQDTDTAATAGGEALGGERDILINHLAGANNVDVTVNSGGAGLLSISTGAGTTGNAVIVYDGVDGDATTIDHGNLSVDLTTGGASAFHFLAGSEAGNTMTITVFSGSTNFSTATVNLPVTAGAVATEDVIIRFAPGGTSAAFGVGGGTGADFTAVTAIQMQVDMAAATDAQFDFTQIVRPFVSTQDFPNLNPITVGNQVFRDANDNGVLDAGESGISGVTVRLHEDTNLNGSYDDGVDQQVATTTTDVSGNFTFTNLLPGEYISFIPISDFATNSDPLFGFFSSNNGGAFEPAPDPDTTETDSDDNGTLIAGVGVATAAYTLTSAGEPITDGDADTNTNLGIDFGFANQIDVEVSKSASVSTVSAGDQLTYTITVTNNGPTSAENVVVVDDLPDFMTFVSSTTTGTLTQTGNSSGEIQVDFASIASGASETITLVVAVPATQAATASVTNSVTVTSDGQETDNSNNTATADVAIDRSAVLTITKTDSPDPVVVGSNLTYTILVTNTGPSTATNVSITDTLPAGLTFVSATESTGTGTAGEAGGVVTATVPTLAVSNAVTVTIVATVDATFSGASIANTAAAEADEATQVTANSDTTVNPQVDLSITKSDSADPVNRGDQFTYTLDIANAGPSGATNVEVVDTLPAGVTFVSATGGTVTPPSGGSSDVTVAVGNVASGGSAQVTITVSADQSAGASVNNSAIVRSTESTNGFDTDASNNTATETTALQSTVDLVVTKTDSADPVIPGESFDYTITVTNNGPSDATLVTLTDNIPDGIQITNVTTSAGTATTPATAQDAIAANNDDLTVDIGNVATTDTVTITVTALVLADTTGTLSNVATVATGDTAAIESDAANNSITETTTLTPRADLVVTQTGSVDPVIAGETLTYTIQVTNNGPSTATNVVLTDNLPAGVTFSSATPSQGTASEAGGVVTANLGSLAPSTSASITLVVTVDGDTRTSISNAPSVTSDVTDPDASNNTATPLSTTVNASVDLAITKVESSDPVATTGSLTYTIVVTNNGPSDATGVTVTDTLPTGLSFGSGTSTVGSVTNAGGVVTGNIGTLASGASATITLVTSVDASASGTLSNTASVTSTETDSDTANNAATETTDVAVPGSISGSVYEDANENGVEDAGEDGLAGVTIALTGTDILGNTVSETTTTDANGDYSFTNLLPGTYTLTETQPTGVQDAQVNPGTGTTSAGTAGTNEIASLTLGSGENGVAFNFGELAEPLSLRLLLSSSFA